LVALIPSTAGAAIVWIIWSCFFAALSILAIEFISPNAAGSGIPEMKCILSGIEIDRFLNFRTLVAKVAGLIFAFAGGLSIGKEGPFVHISAIVCSLLSKLSFFSHVRKNQAVYLQMLAAACGTGTPWCASMHSTS
jgi:H+/Cl- antiporter ClcA